MRRLLLLLVWLPGCALVHERPAALPDAGTDTPGPHRCDTLADVLAGGCVCEPGPFVELVDASRQEAHLASTAHGIFASAWGGDVRPTLAPIALAPTALGVVVRESDFGVTGQNDPILVADPSGAHVALAWYELSPRSEDLLAVHVAVAGTQLGEIVGHDSDVEGIALADPHPLSAPLLVPLDEARWRIVRVDDDPRGAMLVTHDVQWMGDRVVSLGPRRTVTPVAPGEATLEVATVAGSTLVGLTRALPAPSELVLLDADQIVQHSERIDDGNEVHVTEDGAGFAVLVGDTPRARLTLRRYDARGHLLAALGELDVREERQAQILRLPGGWVVVSNAGLRSLEPGVHVALFDEGLVRVAEVWLHEPTPESSLELARRAIVLTEEHLVLGLTVRTPSSARAILVDPCRPR